MDLAQATNAREPVTLAGRTYMARQLKLREWAELTAWLRKSVPSPVSVALQAVDDLRRLTGHEPPRSTVETLYDKAFAEARAWPPPIGTRAWIFALDRALDGPAEFVRTALAAAGQALSLDEARAVADAATPEEYAELVRVCYFGDPPDPKPATPASTTTTEPTPGDGPPTETANATTPGPSGPTA